MPFTFSHPAIVLGLGRSKSWFSLTALIIGSMVPDFEFYFRMQLGENIGHHLNGFFVFDIPVAIVSCFVYHNIIRNTLINQLPDTLRNGLFPFTRFNWNRYAKANKSKVAFSLLVGILSHLFWDAWTHQNGVFVTMFSILQHSFYLFFFSIPVYSLLQVISSIWGLWIVYKYINSFITKPRTVSLNNTQNRYWVMVLLGMLIFLTVRMLAVPDFRSVWDFVFALIGSGFYALLITSVIYRKPGKFRLPVQ